MLLSFERFELLPLLALPLSLLLLKLLSLLLGFERSELWRLPLALELSQPLWPGLVRGSPWLMVRRPGLVPANGGAAGAAIGDRNRSACAAGRPRRAGWLTWPEPWPDPARSPAPGA